MSRVPWTLGHSNVSMQNHHLDKEFFWLRVLINGELYERDTGTHGSVPELSLNRRLFISLLKSKHPFNNFNNSTLGMRKHHQPVLQNLYLIKLKTEKRNF